MRKVYLSITSLFIAVVTWGQITLAGWDVSGLPGGLNDYGPSPFSATTTAPDVTVGGFTRGSGVNQGSTAASKGWGGTGWNNATASDNILADKFITFNIKANSSFAMSLSSINVFDYRRSSSGPTNALIQYQINAGSFVDVTTVDFSSTSTSGASLSAISLSSITDLQNVSSTNTITIRIVPYGATSSAGTFYIYDVGNSSSNDFSILGTTVALAPTPVELFSFAAKKDGSKNILRWTTASENNNKGFEVQSSTDGVRYSTIAFVSSLANGGFSGHSLQYSFTDANPSGTKQYYRLSQLDYDGKARLSNIVLVKGDKPLKLAIGGLFPNPVTGRTLNIFVDAPQKDRITLVVSDISGRILRQQTAHVEDGSNTISLDISTIGKGLYFVRLLSDASAETTVGKFIKQ